MQFKTSVQAADQCLSQIVAVLPVTLGELRASHEIMIQEGLIMNFCIWIARLTSDIENPLLVRIDQRLDLSALEKHTLGA